MAATFSIESTIKDVKDRRDFSADFLANLAALYDLPSSSSSRISQALNEQKPFTNEHEPLRILVQDIDAYCQSVEPIPVALKKPGVIKQLLDQFRQNRQDHLIRGVYIVELADGSLFKKVSAGEIVRAEKRNPLDAAHLADTGIAKAVVGLLVSMGVYCSAVPVRLRTSESSLAKNVQDVGFVPESLTAKE